LTEDDRFALSAYVKLVALVAEQKGIFDVNKLDVATCNGYGVAIATWQITESSSFR
jgi:hypothetical protein